MTTYLEQEVFIFLSNSGIGSFSGFVFPFSDVSFRGNAHRPQLKIPSTRRRVLA